MRGMDPNKPENSSLPFIRSAHEVIADPTKPKGPGQDPAVIDGKRLNPTRYGDWERNGRCIDF